MGDEWTVVGASGKPKKTHKTTQQHVSQGNGAGVDEESYTEQRNGMPCITDGHATWACMHANDADAPQLPGWGVSASPPAAGGAGPLGTSPDNGWGDSPSESMNGTDSMQRRRKGGRKWVPRERTTEEVVAWLQSGVEEARCAAEHARTVHAAVYQCIECGCDVNLVSFRQCICKIGSWPRPRCHVNQMSMQFMGVDDHLPIILLVFCSLMVPTTGRGWCAAPCMPHSWQPCRMRTHS